MERYTFKGLRPCCLAWRCVEAQPLLAPFAEASPPTSRATSFWQQCLAPCRASPLRHAPCVQLQHKANPQDLLREVGARRLDAGARAALLGGVASCVLTVRQVVGRPAASSLLAGQLRAPGM